jgi:hypothetical protein
MGAARTSRLRPCPSARPGVASARATRAEGDHPPERDARKSASAQARAKPWRRGSKKSAEDRGDRPGRRRHLPALYPGAREGRSPIVPSTRKRPVGPVQLEPLGATPKKRQTQERQHRAALRRDAGPTAIPRPVKKAPAGGSASRRRGTRRDPGPSASGEGNVIVR